MKQEDIKKIESQIEGFSQSFDEFKAAISDQSQTVESRIEASEKKAAEFQKQLEEYKKSVEETIVWLQKEGKSGGEDGELAKIEGKYSRDFADFICNKKDLEDMKPIMREYASSLKEQAEKTENYAEALELKGFATDSHGTGGVLVPMQIANEIVKKQRDFSPVRSEARVLTTGVSKLRIPVENDDFGFSWVGERQSHTADGAGSFLGVDIELSKGRSKVPVTREMMQDSGFNILNWITESAANKFSRGEGNGFVLGTGGLQPKGFMTYDSGTSFGQIQQLEASTSTAIVYDDFIDLETLLRAFYYPGSKYYMNRFIRGYVRKIKDGDSRPYFPKGNSINENAVVVLDDMAGSSSTTLTGGDLVIAFGDMRRAYTILDQTMAMHVVIDNITDIATDQVNYNFFKRVGGGVVDFDALKIMSVKS